MYTIYWIISENKRHTYVGFTNELTRRLSEHKNKRVQTTSQFGNFQAYKIEEVQTDTEARKREKYWKSCVGRKRLKIIFNKMFLVPSSSG